VVLCNSRYIRCSLANASALCAQKVGEIDPKYLMETCLIRTEEAPLDIAVAEANVEDLAIGRHVRVVPVSFSVAAEFNFTNKIL
jgi:hypothetical protein